MDSAAAARLYGSTECGLAQRKPAGLHWGSQGDWGCRVYLRFVAGTPASLDVLLKQGAHSWVSSFRLRTVHGARLSSRRGTGLPLSLSPWAPKACGFWRGRAHCRLA